MSLFFHAPSVATGPPGPVERRFENLPAGATVASVRVKVLDARAVGDADQAAWAALEARALEPNLNHSPHFALPALRHLDPALPVLLFLAERMEPGGARLIGAALVHRQRADRFFALPHLGSYHCRHAFLGHWLLDRDDADAAALQLLREVRRRRRGAAALLLPSSPVDGPQRAVMQGAAARLGIGAEAVGVKARAVFVPAQGGVEALKAQIGKQYGNVERCRRRLLEQGTLDWQLLRGEVPAGAVEDFLALEHTGWKRESGTSLRSCPAEEAFFREMTERFSRAGRALFTELRLNGRVIASTCNYVSGETGFAFKVGWDEQYRKFGLGIFNEAELVRHAPERCADLQCLDSGSQPASFIEMLWPGRRQVALLVLPFGVAGRLTWWAQKGFRRLLGRLRPAPG